MEGRELIAYIICYIISAIIVLITFCLIFIYIKTKELHSYPCYFNILLSSVISLDNLLRLIPFYDKKSTTLASNSIGCKFQGFTLALLDKFMLTTMTIFSIISFLGLLKYDFYKKYEKIIFIILTITGFLISLILAILFSLNGVVNYEDVCYVRYKKNNDNEPELKVNKVVIDGIITSILFLINLYCIIRLLIYIYFLIKETKKENNDIKTKNYYFHFWKFFVDFLLTCLTFIMIILIIADKFFDVDEFISLSYVFLSLLIVIFFTINMRVLKEGKKIILCKKDENKPKNKEMEEEDNSEIIRED